MVVFNDRFAILIWRVSTGVKKKPQIRPRKLTLSIAVVNNLS